MILTTTLDKDTKGNIQAAKSEYRPSKEIKDLTAQFLSDFTRSHTIMTKGYREFNDQSLVSRQRSSQQSFNAYIFPASEDPDEAWHSNAFRPIVRNRVISIAAHITGSLIFPQIQAQNDADQEDKDAATVMRTLVEWVADQSNYEKTFLYAVIAALVNPAVILHTQYTENYRTVKEIQEDGKWTSKEVLDELTSGFQTSLVPLDELFIADIYESDIQKQPYLIWRRAIDFTTAEQKYGQHPNFKKYVRPGIQVMFNESDQSFYQQYDADLQDRLVEEVTYYNRSKDLQLCFLNGILVTDKDQPNPRKDKKYPFVKGGYETYDEGRFFYFKSLVEKLGPDEEVINTLYRLVIDGTYLQLMPPTVVMGDETISSSVVTPGTVTVFQDPNTKVQKIDAGTNLNAGYSTLDRVEKSISETSVDPLQQGQSDGGEKTAFEISRMEENAQKNLGQFSKMIGFLIKDYGQLLVSDILQYLTVGEVMELLPGTDTLKFRSFLLSKPAGDVSNRSRKINFTMDMPDQPLTEEQRLDESFNVMEEGGDETDIYKVNPTIFREMKFKVKVSPNTVTPPSENVKKALKLELYDRAIANPMANQEAVFKDFLLGAYDESKHDPDKYLMKQDPMAAMGLDPNMLNQTQKPNSVINKLATPGKPGSPADLSSKVF